MPVTRFHCLRLQFSFWSFFYIEGCTDFQNEFNVFKKFRKLIIPLKKHSFPKNVKHISLPTSFWANASLVVNKSSPSPFLCFFQKKCVFKKIKHSLNFWLCFPEFTVIVKKLKLIIHELFFFIVGLVHCCIKRHFMFFLHSFLRNQLSNQRVANLWSL